ncbi:MAG: triphosphoribosyl-dephospho-CoA synthase [Methyloceanibacter sp.]|uniref:triphosphoribosyl-dephospho-CoA synthase n=1 Tax=Methyloceanibacter sp. TaxID=1965321 RepID=UPI003D9B21AF
MTGPPKPETIVRAFHDACLAELDALKPGNVHRFRDGHRMTIADFMASADAAAPAIGRAGLPVGARIRLAVEATATAVGQNTNLGMVLLAAPLANAALDQGKGDLQRRLARVLAGLTVDDARETYQAIRAVKPGGLGEVPAHDIAVEPNVTLLEAMRAAETRDRIAWNYTHDFVDIFDLGLSWLRQSEERWGNGPWAVTSVYLGFLAHIPDTLIERKFGARTAAKVAEEARPIESGLIECDMPETMAAPLLAFDRSLKERGLNPGTSADLTVATLFAKALQDAEKGA